MRHFISNIPFGRFILIVLLVVGVFVFLGNSALSVQPVWKPNIIVIQTDDMTYSDMDMRLPSGKFVMTNVRNLIGRTGTTFTNAHVSFSLCCPSRSTMYTGQYAHNHNVLGNGFPLGGFPKLNHTNTLPIWLQQAGYYTAHFGKYMNGYTATTMPGGGTTAPRPAGWSDWFTLVRIVGSPTGAYYNYDIHDNNSFVHFGNTTNDYLTDVLTDRFIQDLSTQPYGAAPFFVVLDYYAPHGEPDIAVPAARHDGMMAGMTAPRPPSFNEADVSDKPLDVRTRPLLTTAEIADIDLRYQKRAESLLAVDEGVGRIIRALKNTGQYDNTIIIFVGDNGWQQGERRLPSEKNFSYLESTHIPLLMRGPRIPANKTISNIVVNVDYAPTFLEWSHATPGLPMDGRSLFPLIQNPSTPWRTDILLENPFIKYYAGLHTQDRATGYEYLYVEYDYDIDGNWDERELYNLTPDNVQSAGDPFMLESQHANPLYASLLTQLHARLIQLKTCVGATCN